MVTLRSWETLAESEERESLFWLTASCQRTVTDTTQVKLLPLSLVGFRHDGLLRSSGVRRVREGDRESAALLMRTRVGYASRLGVAVHDRPLQKILCSLRGQGLRISFLECCLAWMLSELEVSADGGLPRLQDLRLRR